MTVIIQVSQAIQFWVGFFGVLLLLFVWVFWLVGWFCCVVVFVGFFFNMGSFNQNVEKYT